MAENKSSTLLSPEENEFFQFLGKESSTLLTSVVQLLLSEPPHKKWHNRCKGVVCFVKDNRKRSYFIRVYDFVGRQLILEQELNDSFQYKSVDPYFHTIQDFNCMAGLEFFDKKEAEQFKAAINQKLAVRLQKIRERRHQPTQTYQEIDGQPHFQRIVWNTPFDLESLDPNLLKFLTEAGISREELKNTETWQFIYDFIEKRGGNQTAFEEVKLPPPPTPAPRKIRPNVRDLPVD